MTTCESDGSLKSYRCQKEEQCDDCWMVDHVKECNGCDHYDHPEKIIAGVDFTESLKDLQNL